MNIRSNKFKKKGSLKRKRLAHKVDKGEFSKENEDMYYLT